MSLKILLDPVLTASEPARCSTYIQFYTFMTRVLELREDVFFYWPVPRWVTDEDRKWLPQDPRVCYIPITQHRDRTKEYVTMRDEMDKLIAFNGELWDFDILITVRAGMIPLMKMIMTSPRQVNHAWIKEVWLIEEMPMLRFKRSVAVLHPDVQDLWTLSGYLAAEAVYVFAHHETPQILATAREYFGPSRVIALDKKIQSVVPAQLSEFLVKDDDRYFVPGSGKPFCIAYVGRLSAQQTNLDKVYKAMTNQWIIRGGNKVRMLVLTVSQGGASMPPEHIEVQRAPREEFWRIAREDMHVLVFLHGESQFSLSLTEPLMFGVPAILLKARWSVELMGPDYPFFASGEVEAYGLMKMFYEDYAGMYAKFLKWHKEYFVPVFTARFQEELLYDLLLRQMERFETTMLPRFAEKMKNTDNEIVRAVRDYAGKKDIVLFDALNALAEKGKLRSLQQKLSVADRDRRGLVWATAWNDFRLMLKGLHGWTDASVAVGHMRPPA